MKVAIAFGKAPKKVIEPTLIIDPDPEAHRLAELAVQEEARLAAEREAEAEAARKAEEQKEYAQAVQTSKRKFRVTNSAKQLSQTKRKPN